MALLKYFIFKQNNIYAVVHNISTQSYILHQDGVAILDIKDEKNILSWKKFLEMISAVATKSCWNEQLCLYSDNTAEVLKGGRVVIRDSQKHIRHRLMFLRNPKEVADGLNNLISMM